MSLYGLLCDGVVVGGVVLAACIWADIENQPLLPDFSPTFLCSA